MAQLRQSERLFALMARRAQELGRKLKRDEWLEVADLFFADLAKARARSFIHPDAEAIYAAYPRKVAKDAALRAISMAIERRGGESLSLLEATNAYAAAVATWPRAVRFKRSETGELFDTVPHPATWFNRGSYDDDRAQWPVYGATCKQKPDLAADEPARWREYLEQEMPECVYLDGRAWSAIDADMRQIIREKMAKAGFL